MFRREGDARDACLHHRQGPGGHEGARRCRITCRLEKSIFEPTEIYRELGVDLINYKPFPPFTPAVMSYISCKKGWPGVKIVFGKTEGKEATHEKDTSESKDAQGVRGVVKWGRGGGISSQ